MQVRHDERALVTGSADKDIKFWDFEWKQTSESQNQVRPPPHHMDEAQQLTPQQDGFQGPNGRQITLVHTRTLKMTDDVLSVRYSPNGKLLAVALLDSTVKVFYEDSLKFFLSLYGHKVSNAPSRRLTSIYRSVVTHN